MGNDYVFLLIYPGWVKKRNKKRNTKKKALKIFKKENIKIERRVRAL